MSERICSIERCMKAATARGWCGTHYARWKKHGDPLVVKHRHDGNRIDRTQRKRCEQCGDEFGPSPGTAHEQWRRRQFCSPRCKNTHCARQQVKLASTTRREGERWARWWEQQRRREDRADIKAGKRIVYGKGAQRLSCRPRTRCFTACWCIGCGSSFIADAGRFHGSVRCSDCTRRYWRGNHVKRAKHYGVEWDDAIVPAAVFARDGYRCQICGRKTKGNWPTPLSPTVDHIVPLSKGGPHLWHNVQTAHARCNLQKHDGAANDQLRLEVGA